MFFEAAGSYNDIRLVEVYYPKCRLIELWTVVSFRRKGRIAHRYLLKIGGMGHE